jgi:general secretion pathway protein F
MRYQVRGLTSQGGIVVATFDARDAKDATLLAAGQGLAVLSVTQGGGLIGGLAGRARVRFPLLLFSGELLELLDAGISLVEALETLAEKETRRDTRGALDKLMARLREGKPLSAAMAEQPEVFPQLYVAIVRASEKTGDMTQALGRYVAYETKVLALRAKLVSAMIYPAILVAVGGLVTLFLLGYVVPRFSTVYEGRGDNLPWMAQFMMQWGRLVEAYGPTLLAATLGALVVLGAWLARPATRARLAALLWRVPALGERMRIYQLARFYRTWGMLLRGGLAAVPSLDMVSGLLQPELRARLDEASKRIREGRQISDAMDEHGLTTAVALRMLRVGERTGRMGEMMERIARFYDDEQARWIDWATKLFEPILMAFIGLFIGLIVLLMYMPLFGLADSIQ